MNINSLIFKTKKTTANGALTFIEGNRDIPFEIKRIYYIYGEKAGKQRGFHAHKKLQQVLFCPYGKINVTIDDGKEKKEILLDKPEMGLMLNSMTWREMTWLEDDSVLCVLASDYYDENDYIRDYEDFLKYVKGLGL